MRDHIFTNKSSVTSLDLPILKNYVDFIPKWARNYLCFRWVLTVLDARKSGNTQAEKTCKEIQTDEQRRAESSIDTNFSKIRLSSISFNLPGSDSSTLVS